MKPRPASALYFGGTGLLLSLLVFKPFGGAALFGPRASEIHWGLAATAISALLSGLLLGGLFGHGFWDAAVLRPSYKRGLAPAFGVAFFSCPLTGFFAGLAVGARQAFFYHSLTPGRILPQALAMALLAWTFIFFVTPLVLILSLVWMRLLRTLAVKKETGGFGR
ncbi:MAG TPA: hypothetical protein VL688_03490 [Verrucomicrobiae bacterium]|jgi:hypothetical protein|nr:hypothetical protein [Verrucomicrobiae bacterium]